MILGDIIRVEGNDTYIVKIPADGSIMEPLGKFVKINRKGDPVIGVIKGVIHGIREELLPYVAPEKQPKYLPYDEDFRESYYIIHGLGVLNAKGPVFRVDVAPRVKDPAEPLGRDEVRSFHYSNGKPSIAYFSKLKNVLGVNVLLSMIWQIEECLPESRGMLRLVRKHIERER